MPQQPAMAEGGSRRWVRFSAVLLWILAISALAGVLLRDRDDHLAATPTSTPRNTNSDIARGPVRDPNAAANAAVTQGPLPDFQLTERSGRTITREDLIGKPWVASFIFTRCMSTCPTITRQIKELHDRLETADCRFVSVSVDPNHDTPALLREYAGNFGADPQRWLFLTGSQEEIYKLISNGFRLYVKEMFGKERRPGFEIAHTNRVVLVNAKGTAVATFLATRDSDMVTLRRILEGKRPMPEPGKYGPISAPGSTEPAGDPADVDSDISDEAAADVSPPVSARESVTRTGSEHAAEAAAHSASDASREAPARTPDWVYTLPRINALLNGTATVLLAFGFVAVKRRNIATHKALMLSAFGVSIAFLTCYLIYHASLHSHTGSGSTRFEGTGIVRPVYYSILVTHVILAAAVPFLAVVTILRGLRNDIERHRGIARITFPIWLYVSVTGVIIYLMLYH